MGSDLARVFYAHEVTRQTNVIEIELRRLNQTLSCVGEKGLDLKDDVACLQHTEPLLGRGVGHAGIGAEGTQIDELPNPSRERRTKVRKLAKLRISPKRRT